jgi:dynein heavy chain, axonemal
VDDRFLVYINALVASGWIPDLFPKDELEGLLAGVRTEAKAQVCLKAKGCGYDLSNYFAN